MTTCKITQKIIEHKSADFCSFADSSIPNTVTSILHNMSSVTYKIQLIQCPLYPTLTCESSNATFNCFK